MSTARPSPPAGSRVAVVIGSGSVKCAAALGLFKVLQREGIPIGMVVGCSGGALYAASVAACALAAAAALAWGLRDGAPQRRTSTRPRRRRTFS